MLTAATVLVMSAVVGIEFSSAGATEKGAGSNRSPLTIAIIAPFSGTEAAFGTDAVDGLKLAEKYYGSTINGHPIKMVTFTTKCSGAGAELAWKSAEPDKPIIIMGPGCSSSAVAVNPLFEAAGIPNVNGTYLTTLSEHHDPYYFRVIPDSGTLADVMAGFIKQKHYTRVAILHGTSAFAAGTNVALVKWLKAEGITPVADTAYTTTITTFSGQIESLKADNPDAVYFASYTPAGARACSEMKHLGLNVPCLSNETMPNATSSNAGGTALNGGFYSSPFIPSAKPAFTAVWEKEYRFSPSVESYSTGYVSAVLALEAIKAAGPNPTSKKLDTILHEDTFKVNFGLGEMRFKSTGNPACPARYIATTQNGGKTWEVVKNASVNCK